MHPKPLIARSHALPRGPRVRLRLAQSRDVPAIQTLLQAHGIECQRFEIARLVRFDPRRRVVICATGLIERADTLLGVAAMDVDAHEPDLVCVDEALTDGLSELLEQALVSRAAALAARAA
jgi:uncharacterized protein (DUF58 family)